MIELTFAWEGRSAADFSRVFDIMADVDDFRPVFKEISKDVVIPSLQQHFERGGVEPKWKELTQSTIDRKSRAGVSNPSKILVHSGALRSSATSQDMRQMTKDELRMAPFGIPYYKYHQTGGDRLPQRVIMRLTSTDRTDINTAFANFLRSFINFNPATGGRQFTGGGF